MLGLRQRSRAERPFALELGGGERGQRQRGPEREVVAAEMKLAFDHRRNHENAVGDDALAALQRLRHLGGAEAAIAFAQDEFGRADAAVLGDIERDHLGERLGIAMHAPERAGAVRLGGPAPAGADRIDHHEIGESEPGVRVVGEANVRAVEAVAEHRDARTHEPEIEKSRARSRARH